MIDPKDLRPIKLSEFELDGWFYRKEKDGSFSTCFIDSKEVKDPMRASTLRMYTKIYADAGRLFIRINKPWKNFEQ